MAKVKGLFDVRGNVGDVNMYQLNGKKYIRRTTTMDKAKLMSNPNMKRVRENMMEFGGAGLVAKALRAGLTPVAKRYADSRFSSRMLAVCKRMVKMATGIRGQRPVEPLNRKQLLEGLPLNKEFSLRAVLNLTVDVVPNVGRNGATVTATLLNPDLHIVPPTYASHFKLVLLVVGLTDHVYDASMEGYLAANAAVNGLNAIASSQEIAVTGVAPTTVTLTADLPGAPVMGTTDALCVLVGVEFYQEVSNAYYLLASDNAMDLLKVY